LLIDGKHFLVEQDKSVTALSSSQAFFLSVNSQSLLGLSGITPVTATSRGLIGLQAALTVTFLFLLVS